MTSLLKVFDHYGLELNQQNKANCPFHSEKTPSFCYSEDGDYFYCFGCGASSSVIDFVMMKEEIEFKPALERVKEITGLSSEEILEKKDKEDKQEKVIPLSKEFIQEFFKDKGYKSNNYRGIKDEYNQFYGHLSKLDNTGKVVARYYPETHDGRLVGYKCRNHPKDFSYGKIGTTGGVCELSGQVKFKAPHKYCLIVGGEEDKVAAYQMFMENQKDREQDDFAAIPVVSPTVGETSCVKQVAAQYEWFDMFDNIIIGMDNDAAGRESAKKIAEVLPKHKVKIATWSMNDPNEMLQKGRSRQFLRDFYNAKEIVSTGVKSSTESYDEVRDFLTAEKIPLPPHLHRVQEAHRGGIRNTGCIGNIIGDTSIGKSFVTDTLLNFWIPLEGITPIIVSIERTAGEFTADLLSIYLKRNLTWFMDGHDAVDYLDRPEVAELIDNFLTDDLGRPRFYVIDERDGRLDTLQNKMQMAVSKYGTNLFVIDPLTDILRSLGNESQEDHMMWQKQRKKEGWKIINVLHTRKPTPDKDGKLRKVTEYDALGSSTFVQSSDWNWVINRDKMSTNEVDRNTMTLDIPKVRGGTTGLATELYYDKETRQHFDKIDYFSKQVQEESKSEQVEGQTTREEYEESHFVMED